MPTRRSLFSLSQSESWQFQYPMGKPNGMPGDGCYVMHGYAVENARYYPGLWHTGADWYLTQGDAADAPVYAVADGEVVFAGYDYPGAVVIVQHADDLFSQYGHLNHAVPVQVGQPVARGDLLGSVLFRDGPLSHLHFELRTFLNHPEVNGSTPRYSFHCGPDCPPGPGYWPMDAPEHPSVIGWRNPLHVIAHGMGIPAGSEVMVPADSWAPLFLRNSLDDTTHSMSILLPGGTRLPLVDVWAADDATENVGSAATSVWYQVQVPGADTPMWCPALAPTMHAYQQNGETTSFVFSLIPHH